MNKVKAVKLKSILESTHAEFIQTNQIQNDAIAPALKYKNNRDKELAAFVCAVLAYGKVAHIQKSIKKALDPLGPSPTQKLSQMNFKQMKSMYSDWKHRFNDGNDIATLFLILKKIYQQHNSIEDFLELTNEDDAYTTLQKLNQKIKQLDPEPLKKWPPKQSTFWFLLPDPQAGSACKRSNLFLRWMVGKSEMDLSLWNRPLRRHLIIPVDTHLLKQAQSLGLTKRKQADWKTAVEITNQLKWLDSEDPTRFDFALCHLGIKGRILDWSKER